MALIDLYRRYMYGQSPQDMGFAGGQRLQQGTQGLFGTGGQAGRGGLLTTFEQPDTSGLFNVLSNPYVGIGASLFGAGQRGQTLGMAAGESALQGLQFSETAARLNEARRKRQIIEEYKNQIPEKDKAVFELDPVGYLKQKRQINLTADERNFAAYKRIMQEGTEQDKKLAKDIFVKGGREVKTKQEFLLGIANQLSKDVTSTPESVQEKLPEYEAIYDKIVGDIDSGVKQQNALPVPENKNELIDGQIYDVQGTPRTWNKKKDVFE